MVGQRWVLLPWHWTPRQSVCYVRQDKLCRGHQYRKPYLKSLLYCHCTKVLLCLGLEFKSSEKGVESFDQRASQPDGYAYLFFYVQVHGNPSLIQQDIFLYSPYTPLLAGKSFLQAIEMTTLDFSLRVYKLPFWSFWRSLSMRESLQRKGVNRKRTRRILFLFFLVGKTLVVQVMLSLSVIIILRKTARSLL